MTNPDALARQIILERMSELLTTQEAADLVGCSLATIRNWIRDGRLRAYRMGPRLLRIKPEDLDQLIRRYSKTKYN